MTARKVPVLVEDARDPIDVDRDANLEHVVVVAVAVPAPVHAAHRGLAVCEEQLHMVDLMPRVIDRVCTLGHVQRI